jgi:penicillin V acylase-like amidase (Ntn superfamily)
MKRSKFGSFARYIFLFVTLTFFAPKSIFACTIVSAVGADGQVWNANNEDGAVGVGEFINVFPKTGNAKYGYYTFSHFSPKFGEGGNLQGGMNEAGLTFDFNAIKWVENFNPKSKKVFPQGDEAMLPYILATMDSVQQVINFFKIYWFQNGFRGAQMHVADRHGQFAIISASGIQLMGKGQSLVSTNFDICGKEDGSTCQRYAKATSVLATDKANLATMMAICKETAQGEGTLYSNVQNLTTGDVWFFSKYDPNTTIKINIKKLLLKGRKSYAFNDLKSLTESRPAYKWIKPKPINLTDSIKGIYTGTYHNSFTGNIVVDIDKEGIKISSEDGKSQVLQPQSPNVFFLPNEDVRVEFSLDKKNNQMTVSLYENGFWAFSAWKASSKDKLNISK